MANDDTKNLEKIIKEAIRPLKDMVEIVKHKVDRMESVKEAQPTSIYLMREQQSVMNEKLDAIGKDLNEVKETQEEHTKRLEALSGDIEQLHEDVKGIRDKEGMFHDRNKREIDEIKTHLSLPLIPDTPAI
jgi:uncharacterized coiled-coil DUF342 family protein